MEEAKHGRYGMGWEAERETEVGFRAIIKMLFILFFFVNSSAILLSSDE